MAKYKSIVTTEAGLSLLENAAYIGGAIKFTALKTGNGTYDGTEDLSKLTDLKNVRQSFGIGSVSKKGSDIVIRVVIDNVDVTTGYYMTEMGLYAMNPNTEENVLYAIIVSESGSEDYLPPYSTTPTKITFEINVAITESGESVVFEAAAIEGIYVPAETFEEHKKEENPHGVTKEQVGLSNVPNVATNDQTPTYTEASTLTALTSGEKLSVALGKIAKAVSSLISHIGNKSNPHGVTKAQVGLGNVDNTSDLNKPVSTAVQTELDKKALASTLTSHTGNKSNPHSVTASQVGLGNVPNVATNDQTPTYTAASSLTTLTSGEKLSVAFGKLSKAVSDLISHIGNKSNPHGVTKAQVGLGNVPNVATNDQTPSYTAASSLTALTSGEKLSVAFGKIAKAVSSLISHLADSVKHVTAAERTAWNAKLDATATAVNSGKLNGHDSGYFATSSSVANIINGNSKVGSASEADNAANATNAGTATNALKLGGETAEAWQNKLDMIHGVASGCLPLDGGGTVNGIVAVKCENWIPIRATNTSSDTSCMQFNGKSGTLGYLGISADKKPRFVESDGSTSHHILHSGNYSNFNEFQGVRVMNAGGEEGGEIAFATPLTDHSFDSMIVQDVWRDTMRIFATHDGLTKLFNIDFASMKEGVNEALHTGNSVRVSIDKAAPSDTSALWVVPK